MIRPSSVHRAKSYQPLVSLARLIFFFTCMPSSFAQGLVDDVRQMLPVGIVAPFAGVKIDESGHWMLCDGRALAVPTKEGDAYWELYQAIGMTYGNAKEFRLPDLRGRIPIGRDNMGETPANRISNVAAHNINGTSLGDSGGNETHNLSVAELPKHNHGGGRHLHEFGQTTTENPEGRERIEQDYIAAGNGRGLWAKQQNTSDSGEIIKEVGKDMPHNNIQPSIILNYIIRYRSTR